MAPGTKIEVATCIMKGAELYKMEGGKTGKKFHLKVIGNQKDQVDLIEKKRFQE